LLEEGKDLNVAPYGVEAMSILRIEKGHIVGAELNGRTTAGDLGFGGMISTKKPFIGQRSLSKPALGDGNRKQLVGLKSVDPNKKIPRGAQIVADPKDTIPMEMLGEVTSNCYSPHVESYIGLAIVKRGSERHGDKLWAISPLTKEQAEVELCSPHFVDPQGERLRG
jgi:sarcosine oxidase subunit alpha